MLKTVLDNGADMPTLMNVLFEMMTPMMTVFKTVKEFGAVI